MVVAARPLSSHQAPHIISEISLWMEASRSPEKAGVWIMSRVGYARLNFAQPDIAEAMTAYEESAYEAPTSSCTRCITRVAVGCGPPSLSFPRRDLLGMAASRRAWVDRASAVCGCQPSHHAACWKPVCRAAPAGLWWAGAWLTPWKLTLLLLDPAKVFAIFSDERRDHDSSAATATT